MTYQPIGIAHLTLLSLTPPELVTTAAEVGFDFVGLRVRAATAGETPYPMTAGSPMSRDTLRRLDDTGLAVHDVEFLALDAGTTRADWEPALEAGAALGARTFSVAGLDADRARLTDTLAALVTDARQYDIVPTLEPISYQSVSRVADAAAIASAVGAAVLLDALHVQRGGSSLDDVRTLDPALVPLVQLCDGPLRAPEHLDVSARLPLGMSTDGSPSQLEARALRLPAGAGELPLTGLLRALPPGTPVSVEVPNATMLETLSPAEFARMNRAAARRVLEAAGDPAGNRS